MLIHQQVRQSVDSASSWMRQTFGTFMNRWREEHGILQKDMAKNIGVPASFLSQVERGLKTLPDNVGKRLLKEYPFNQNELDQLNILMWQATQRIVRVNNVEPRVARLHRVIQENGHLLNNDNVEEIIDLIETMIDSNVNVDF